MYRPLFGCFLRSRRCGAVLIYGILFALLGYSERLYCVDTIRDPEELKITLGKVGVWTTFLSSAVVVFAGGHARSYATLTAGTALNYMAMLGWRHWWQWRLAQNNRHERNVLIVGAGKLGRKVATWLEQDHPSGRTVLGFLDDDKPVGGDVLGGIRDLARIARAEFVDEIIVALPDQHDLAKTVIGEARRNGLNIKLVPDLHGFEAVPRALEDCGGIPLLTVHEELAPELGLFLKRALDVLLSLLGLAVITPLLAAVALVIKLDSAGPVFYRAPRVGEKRKAVSLSKVSHHGDRR